MTIYDMEARLGGSDFLRARVHGCADLGEANVAMATLVAELQATPLRFDAEAYANGAEGATEALGKQVRFSEGFFSPQGIHYLTCLSEEEEEEEKKAPTGFVALVEAERAANQRAAAAKEARRIAVLEDDRRRFRARLTTWLPLETQRELALEVNVIRGLFVAHFPYGGVRWELAPLDRKDAVAWRLAAATGALGGGQTFLGADGFPPLSVMGLARALAGLLGPAEPAHSAESDEAAV